MTPCAPLLRGLILAGGGSTRMGVEKAGLRYNGEPQVRRLAGMLAQVLREVFVSVGSAQTEDPLFSGLPLLVDEVAGLGPMGGILRAFHHDPRSAWLAIAVDMPGITVETVTRLVDARDPSAFATAYRSPRTGDPEPVLAIYEPAILPVLEEAGAAGRLSLMLLKTLDVRLLDAASSRELANVNDPAEYEAWLKGV